MYTCLDILCVGAEEQRVRVSCVSGAIRMTCVSATIGVPCVSAAGRVPCVSCVSALPHHVVVHELCGM